jgi:nitronate monooxygenase
LIQRSLRNTVRVLRKPLAETVADMEKNGASLDQLGPFISGQRGKKMLDSGEIDQGLLAAGQAVGLVHDIPTVKELIDRIVKHAEEIVSQLSSSDIYKPGRLSKPHNRE